MVIELNITFSRTSVTVPAISTTSSGENVFVTCQFEFALETLEMHANRFVCKLRKMPFALSKTVSVLDSSLTSYM